MVVWWGLLPAVLQTFHASKKAVPSFLALIWIDVFGVTVDARYQQCYNSLLLFSPDLNQSIWLKTTVFMFSVVLWCHMWNSFTSLFSNLIYCLFILLHMLLIIFGHIKRNNNGYAPRNLMLQPVSLLFKKSLSFLYLEVFFFLIHWCTLKINWG